MFDPKPVRLQGRHIDLEPLSELHLQDLFLLGQEAEIWTFLSGKPFVKFEDAVQEIFAVEVLPHSINPDLINHDRKIIGSTYELPDSALADVPNELKIP